MTVSGVPTSASTTNAGSNADNPAAPPANAPSTIAVPAVMRTRCEPAATPRYHVAFSLSGTLSVNRARYGETARHTGTATAAPAQVVVAMDVQLSRRRPSRTGLWTSGAETDRATARSPRRDGS